MNDIINSEWIIKLDQMVEDYIHNKIGILDFSNDQLQYLIYWNFGYSGITTSDYAINAENELNARGIKYNEALVEEINEKAEGL